MNTKNCSKCKQVKPISDFYKRSGTNNYKNPCKECCQQSKKLYYQNNKEKINKRTSERQKNNPARKEYRHQYYLNNKEKSLQQSKEYFQKNEQHLRKYYKDYSKSHIKEQIEYRKIYWYNTPKGKEARLKSNLSRRIRFLLKSNGLSKTKRTLDLICCSIEFLKEHLQQTAIQNGYLDFNIHDYSGNDYHIDHIIPCAAFDLINEKEQRKCFRWSNLQILTANENLIKSDNYQISLSCSTIQ